MNGIGVAGRLFFLRLFGSGSLARYFALLLLLPLWERERGMPRSELSTAIEARLVLRGRAAELGSRGSRCSASWGTMGDGPVLVCKGWCSFA